MSIPRCPKCGSRNILTERRIDGDSTCRDCGYKDKSKLFRLEDKKVEYIDVTGNLINDLNERYHKGDIKAGIFIIINNEGIVETAECGGASYLERLGMLEVAKQNIMLEAACPFYSEDEE